MGALFGLLFSTTAERNIGDRHWTRETNIKFNANRIMFGSFPFIVSINRVALYYF